MSPSSYLYSISFNYHQTYIRKRVAFSSVHDAKTHIHTHIHTRIAWHTCIVYIYPNCMPCSCNYMSSIYTYISYTRLVTPQNTFVWKIVRSGFGVITKLVYIHTWQPPFVVPHPHTCWKRCGYMCVRVFVWLQCVFVHCIIGMCLQGRAIQIVKSVVGCSYLSIAYIANLNCGYAETKWRY